MSMSATAAESPVRPNSMPAPPAPPATLKETGLHPDTLSQLLLKTLVAGEASGTGLADEPAAAVFDPGRADPARAASRSSSKSGAPAAPAAPGIATRSPTSAATGPTVLRRLALRRAGPGAARAVQRLRAGLHGGAAVHRPRAPGDRLQGPDRQRLDVRSARAGGELGQVAVPLRRARQRQDRRRRGHRAGARRGDAHPARPRRRRADDHDVRPGEPPRTSGPRRPSTA